MRVFEISVDMFKVTATVVACNNRPFNREDLANLLKDGTITQEQHDYVADRELRKDWKGFFLNMNGTYLVILNSCALHHAVHELFHLTEEVLLSKDIPHCEQTSEVYAYLLEHLVRQYNTKYYSSSKNGS